MAKKADSAESVIASADAANAKVGGRKYAGPTGPQVVATPNQDGLTQDVPRHAVAGDPTVMAAPSRQGVERNGGTYAVVAGVNKPVDPAISGQTMANARMLPSAINRSGSFADGGTPR